jgi:exopolysaccharide biosynthesis polyprenyl glycosylphosphotransferase
MARVKPHRTWLWSVGLAVIDFANLLICAGVSSLFRGYASAFSNLPLFSALLIMLTCGVGLSIIGGYDQKRDMATLKYFSEHVLAMGAVLLFAFIFTYVFSAYNESVKPGRSLLFLTLILFTPVSLGYRYNLSKRVNQEAAARYIYVVGTPDLLGHLSQICERASLKHPLRFFDLDQGKRRLFQGMERRLTDPGDYSRVKASSPPRDICEAVVVDLSKMKPDPEWEELLLKINLHSVPVYPVGSFIEAYFHQLDLSYVTLGWALDGTFKPSHHNAYGNVKTMIDFMVAAFLFAALGPLMLAIALMIKLEDAGPALFRQSRIGRFNRPFVLYKFRSMKVTSEATQNPYTTEEDSRITRVGRILRLTRLDELPQLWNVLLLDMSLIGPRAEWDRLVGEYEKEIPFYHLRHMVKPGITGWAQVNYAYGVGAKDAREKLQYDLYYIKHYSPPMDASIVLKTIFTMLSASGR